MRHYDEDEALRLNAQPWQVDLLKVNPPYCSWGPHEDYMCNTGSSWDSPLVFPTWPEFGPWKLDELNECVNFYFSVTRESEECTSCSGNGYHPDAQPIVRSFYSHMNPAGEHWDDAITQDEVQALVDNGRLKEWTHDWSSEHGWVPKDPPCVPTADAVNAAQRGPRIGHDGINRIILTEARLRRLGLPITCPTCDGRGDVFTEPDAHVSLTLWWLHPRKGCSRGIEVTRISQEDLPAVKAFLESAAARNASRFTGVSSLT